MPLTTIVLFEDGREETIRADYIDFGEAVAHAVRLADDYGTDTGDGHGPPVWVMLKRGSHIELSLKVFRGGLISKDDR